MPITPGNLKTAEIMLSGRATAHRMEHIDAPFSPLPPPGGGFIPSGEKVKDLTQKSGLSPDHDIVVNSWNVSREEVIVCQGSVTQEEDDKTSFALRHIRSGSFTGNAMTRIVTDREEEKTVWCQDRRGGRRRRNKYTGEICTECLCWRSAWRWFDGRIPNRIPFSLTFRDSEFRILRLKPRIVYKVGNWWILLTFD